MSFKRSILPHTLASGEELTSHLIGIGFLLGGTPYKNANIENTLIAASIEGLAGDGRILSLLVDWIEIHSLRINADRLVQIILQLAPQQTFLFSVFWAAIGEWFKSDIRFTKLKKLSPKKRFDFLGDRTDFLIKKNGEDERFKKTCLRIPQKVLRHRPGDILPPEELAKIHLPYKFRILMGPTYRSDMWALFCQKPQLSAAQVAKDCYGSYPTAFMVKRDFKVLGKINSKINLMVSPA
ncbi:hypothetical protein K1X76_02085 [bacterium]|nr:hypothetical protein [bacterium]